jgi:hypothetical protein
MNQPRQQQLTNPNVKCVAQLVVDGAQVAIYSDKDYEELAEQIYKAYKDGSMLRVRSLHPQDLSLPSIMGWCGKRIIGFDVAPISRVAKLDNKILLPTNRA